MYSVFRKIIIFIGIPTEIPSGISDQNISGVFPHGFMNFSVFWPTKL